jgi:hypothetical protein
VPDYEVAQQSRQTGARRRTSIGCCLWKDRFEGDRSELSSIDYARSRRKRGSGGRPHSCCHGVVRLKSPPDGHARGHRLWTAVAEVTPKRVNWGLLDQCSSLLEPFEVLGVVGPSISPHREHEHRKLAAQGDIGFELAAAVGKPPSPLHERVVGSSPP